MSAALNNAIYARLAGTERMSGAAKKAQVALAALLGTDARTQRPAVVFGNKARTSVFPCITFRPSGGGPAFETVEGASVSGVLYDFEFWEKGLSSDLLCNIADSVERLLNTRRGVAKPMRLANQHKLFDSVTLTEMTLLYDSQSNAWFGLQRYQFTEARNDS